MSGSDSYHQFMANTRLSEAKKQIEQLKEDLEKMKMLYGIIDDAYKALPKNEKEWVDNNWKSMIYKWADDLEESAFSSCQDMSSDEETEQEEIDCDDDKNIVNEDICCGICKKPGARMYLPSKKTWYCGKCNQDE